MPATTLTNSSHQSSSATDVRTQDLNVTDGNSNTGPETSHTSQIVGLVDSAVAPGVQVWHVGTTEPLDNAH